MTSPNFSDVELKCPCCGVNGMKQEALDLAEDVRFLCIMELGEIRLLVNSAYRCPEHNKSIGGAPKSQHVQGLALDLILQKKVGKEWQSQSPRVFERIARKSKKLGGIGPDDQRGFLHIDARPCPSTIPAQWCYHNGKEIKYYSPKQAG